MNDLKIGDTIKCHDVVDMLRVASELGQYGIIANHIGDYRLQIVAINLTESELEA